MAGDPHSRDSGPAAAHTRSPLLQRMRAAGLRPTVARIDIMQEIESADQPLAVEDIYERLMRRGVTVTVGTVYRVVHELVAGNLVLREWDRNRRSLFRIMATGEGAPTLRMVCDSTGRSIAITDADLHDRLIAAANREGLEISGETLSVHVICAAPVQRNRAANGGRGRQRAC